MSHGEASGNGKSNPVGMAIAISIGTLVMIIGIILLAKFAVDTHPVGKDGNAFSEKETAKRIEPVARLAIEGGTPVASAVAAPAAPAPSQVAAAPAAGGKVDGKSTYDSACAACHSAGVAGAPKTGDKAAWAPRVKTGNATLYASAIKGKGAMPAKGGNTSLSDDAVKAAVDHMLAQVK
jgi:cytochrome c5